jgi:hypothetical protein
VAHGEVMLAAVDTAATRLQQRHPQVKLARLPCGHAIPLERPKELADSISVSLKRRQLSGELPSWRGPALKAGPAREIHLIPIGFTIAAACENAG